MTQNETGENDIQVCYDTEQQISMFDQLTENEGDIDQVDVEIEELQINDSDPLNLDS